MSSLLLEELVQRSARSDGIELLRGCWRSSVCREPFKLTSHCPLLPVSGGFATMHPNNRLTVNAIEAYPIDDFAPDVSVTRE